MCAKQPHCDPSKEQTKTILWMGDLEPWMDENYIKGVFLSAAGEIVNVKAIRDKFSGAAKYCFLEFTTPEAVTKALGLNGSPVPNSSRRFKLNWAGGGSLVYRRGSRGVYGDVEHHRPTMGGTMPQQHIWGGGIQQGGSPYGGGFNPVNQMNQFTDPNNTTVFVGGVSGSVTEDELRSFFQGFGEIAYVKIPPGKGCGFIEFVHRHSAEMAIKQMQGYPIGNSRVRVSWGRSQNNHGVGTPYQPVPPPPHYPRMSSRGPTPYGPHHFGGHVPGLQGPSGPSH